MRIPALQQAFEEVKKANEEFKNALPADAIEKAKAVREAAARVRTGFNAQQFPAVLAKYVVGVQAACEKVFENLMPDEQPYDDNRIRSLKTALNDLLTAVKKFEEMEEVYDAAKTEPSQPILSNERWWTVAGVALALVVLGAIVAFGWPAYSSAYNGLYFAAFFLGVVWVYANLMARKPRSELSGSVLQYIVFGGMAFFVLILLIAGVWTGKLIDYLSTIPQARGLITFLIAIGTIAIALILSLASVLMEGSNADVLRERLSKGKEILTVLVGVLGTIVGFYFANNPDGLGAMSVHVVSVPPTVQPGGEFDVIAFTTGGMLPYDPAPIIKPSKGMEGEGSVNPQGRIDVKFKVAADAKPGILKFEVGANDKSEKGVVAKSEITVVPKPP